MTTQEPPEIGAVVLDEARDLVGVVVEVDGMLVRLRCPGNEGARWRARVADVRPASPAQELGAKVADVNACHAFARRWQR